MPGVQCTVYGHKGLMFYMTVLAVILLFLGGYTLFLYRFPNNDEITALEIFEKLKNKEAASKHSVFILKQQKYPQIALELDKCYMTTDMPVLFT
jgi:hypothetical protein